MLSLILYSVVAAAIIVGVGAVIFNALRELNKVGQPKQRDWADYILYALATLTTFVMVVFAILIGAVSFFKP